MDVWVEWRDGRVRARPGGWRGVGVWVAVMVVSAVVAWYCLGAYREGQARIAANRAQGVEAGASVVRSNRNALVLGGVAVFVAGGSLLGAAGAAVAVRRGRD